MQLEFEIIKNNIGVGNYPDIIHFANTQAQIFSITDGELYGVPTDKIDYGEWEGVVLQDESKVSPDIDMSHFEVKVLPGWGTIGGYKTADKHKMIIYEFAYEMGQYLDSASIKHNIDNPISSFNLSLKNPDLKDPEHPGNVAVNEENSLLSPGAKVKFYFGAGEDELEFEMGTFYIDRSNFTLLSETSSADGRNSIGKVLKDQTVDEKNEYWYDLISEHIKKLFENANIEREYYLVENTSEYGWFNFSPNIDYKKGLDTMLEVLPQWKTRELADGTIVVGSPTYNGFESNGIYAFYRNKDIFSRNITRDDAQAYNRVCVHTENYGNVVFRDVASFKGWNLQANKTLYVQVTNGLKQTDIENYADELALRLEDSGKIESFAGPFRPHLMCGDEAIIIGENGSKSLGLITEITHNFGKSGFFTNFTVDSGGTVGKGRLSDFISKIAIGSMSQKAEVGWNDVDMEDYFNLAESATIKVSSTRYSRLAHSKDYLNDGNIEVGTWTSDGFVSDPNPNIVFQFGQRCLINKMVLFLGWDNYDNTAMKPRWYKIQYWNSSFWVDLLEVTETNTPGGSYTNDVIKSQMVHEFETIETSMVRILLESKILTTGNEWREVEIWGNM